MLDRVIAKADSVCLSVCLSHSWSTFKRFNIHVSKRICTTTDGATYDQHDCRIRTTAQTRYYSTV